MPELNEIVEYCDTLLDAAAFQDYCPTGLPVDGRVTVSRTVSCVTATQALIERAVAEPADRLRLHHG